jgi:hypothetical protein
MSIMDAPFHIVKMFMPKPYGYTISGVDIEDINTAKVSLHLIYKETLLKLNRTPWPLTRKNDYFLLHVHMLSNMAISWD